MGIDLILIFPAGHDFTAVLPPFENSVLSAKAVKRRLKFDVLIAAENSPGLDGYTAYFQNVKGRPGETKGILRVQL
jgi:hypothetical protein